MKEKMKIYLDTNIVYGYFLAKNLSLRGEAFKLPAVIQFLKDQQERFEYYVSILMKTEIMRILVSELGLEKGVSRKMWQDFLDEINASEIKIEEPLDEIYKEILAIVEETRIKKRVTNLEHLIVAKNSNFVFLTGDNEILEKCKTYHPRVMSYTEMRGL